MEYPIENTSVNKSISLLELQKGMFEEAAFLEAQEFPKKLPHAQTERKPAITTTLKRELSNKILKQLLEQTEEVDFRYLLNIKEGKDKPKQKNYVVVIIEQILSAAQQQNLDLCMQHDFVYVYNGEYWQSISKEELKTFIGLAAEKMGYSKLESRYYEFREKLYKQFLSASNIPVPEPSKNCVLINLKNGTAEINEKGMRIRDFDKDDFLTYQLPFRYDSEAPCPIFEKFMAEVLPDEQLQEVMAEFFAYIFTKHLKLEKCLLLYGAGANGKSVFFEIINQLIGQDNISNLSLGNLRKEYNRALLKNKLLNYGSEIRGNIEADILKQLVSGEPVQARLKYGNPFILRNYAKLAFNCNTLPKDVEQTNAYFRRFIIIPFNVTIPEEQQDPLLAQKIIDKELAGVFNWILMGLNRLLKNKGFSPSESIKKEIESYKKESDSVWLFIDENNYTASINEHIYLKDLYNEYKDFCRDNSYRHVSNMIFSKRLKQRNFEILKKKKGRVVYIHQVPPTES